MIRALVTGATSPIGTAIARRLARDGMRVIVHAHRQADAARALAAEIAGEGWVADISDIGGTEAALGPVLEAGPVGVIVHNAGLHEDVPLAGMSERQWRDVIGVSLDGFFAVTRPLLLPMMATRRGRIVALSSVSARMGNRGQANYAAAKAGLEGAVRSLAREVASRGITVNAVAPGLIDSPAVRAAFDAGAAELVPMRRLGRPEEVANLVGFLVSDEAGYISGQTIAINGGMA